MTKAALLLAAVSLFVFSPRPVLAQELVTTGVVIESMPQKGMLTVRSDQTNGPITFQGVAATNIFTVDGNPAQLLDLTTGTKVTIQYATRGNVLTVAKIMFGEAKPAGAMTPAAPAAGAMPAGGIVPKSGTNPTGYPDKVSGVSPLNTSNRRQ